jgi:intracellular sulfur oxidation DsrE/DsrF family protein
MVRSIAPALLAGALVLFAVAAAAGDPPVSAAKELERAPAPAGARYKVILHVGDGEPAKWNVALNNVANIQKDLGAANVDVELVAINAGLAMLKLDSVVGGRVAEAMKAGAKVVACENSMSAQKVTRDDMLPGIGYVTAGVVELMQRQREGYAYIRP